MSPSEVAPHLLLGVVQAVIVKYLVCNSLFMVITVLEIFDMGPGDKTHAPGW